MSKYLYFSLLSFKVCFGLKEQKSCPGANDRTAQPCVPPSRRLVTGRLSGESVQDAPQVSRASPANEPPQKTLHRSRTGTPCDISPEKHRISQTVRGRGTSTSAGEVSFPKLFFISASSSQKHFGWFIWEVSSARLAALLHLTAQHSRSRTNTVSRFKTVGALPSWNIPETCKVSR